MIKDNVVYGPPLPIPTPTVSAGLILYQQLIKHVYNSNKAFVDEETGRYLTYKQFLQLSCDLAEALRKDGICKEDVMAICSENNIYFFVVVMAGLFVGLPITTINPIYTETELKHALDLTYPSRIFCTSSLYQKFTNFRSKRGHIKRIMVTDIDNDVPVGASMMDFIKEHGTLGTNMDTFIPTPLEDPNHIAFILFSSGTTGLPKGVMTTHKNTNARLMSLYNQQLWYRSSHADVLGVLPFFHAFGMQMILGHLFEGKTTHVMKQFDPLVYLSVIQKYRIDNISVVPALLTFLATHPIVAKFDLSSLKDVGYGSSPASPAILKTFTERFNVTPRQGYGLTEATLAVAVNPVGIEKKGSIGLLYPGISAYIRDPKTGRKLGPNQSGEICLKGDLITKGYYKNESATRETFTEDGYLRTGDVGYYDKEEYFYLVDRMKELIKYKSFQVAPAELESILVTHPKIKLAAVVGLPDDKVGELPMAFIVKEPNTDLTEKEVKSYLAGFLSKNKHLHGGVVFVDDIPLNSLGKISRKDVRKMLSQFKSKL